MTCFGIDHKRLRKCADCLPRCIICTGPYKIEKYQCRVNGSNKGSRKISDHDVIEIKIDFDHSKL